MAHPEEIVRFCHNRSVIEASPFAERFTFPASSSMSMPRISSGETMKSFRVEKPGGKLVQMMSRAQKRHYLPVVQVQSDRSFTNDPLSLFELFAASVVNADTCRGDFGRIFRLFAVFIRLLSKKYRGSLRLSPGNYIRLSSDSE